MDWGTPCKTQIPGTLLSGSCDVCFQVNGYDDGGGFQDTLTITGGGVASASAVWIDALDGNYRYRLQLGVAGNPPPPETQIVTVPIPAACYL